MRLFCPAQRKTPCALLCFGATADSYFAKMLALQDMQHRDIDEPVGASDASSGHPVINAAEGSGYGGMRMFMYMDYSRPSSRSARLVPTSCCGCLVVGGGGRRWQEIDSLTMLRPSVA